MSKKHWIKLGVSIRHLFAWTPSSLVSHAHFSFYSVYIRITELLIALLTLNHLQKRTSWPNRLLRSTNIPSRDSVYFSCGRFCQLRLWCSEPAVWTTQVNHLFSVRCLDSYVVSYSHHTSRLIDLYRTVSSTK